jgi:hypothetical protein
MGSPASGAPSDRERSRVSLPVPMALWGSREASGCERARASLPIPMALPAPGVSHRQGFAPVRPPPETIVRMADECPNQVAAYAASTFPSIAMRTPSHTRAIWDSLIVGNIGSDTTSRAACSATGSAPEA